MFSALEATQGYEVWDNATAHRGNRTVTGNYNPWIVVLSVVIAIIASYSALGLASRVSASKGRAAKLWLVGGAFSMGVGIWSMHFIGMLAFHLHVPISYDVPLTLGSMVAAIVSSWLALFIIRRGAQDLRTYAVSGMLMGTGISAMHYTGMAAMRMSPPIRYDPTLFVLSVLIAVVASMAALWMAFRLESARSAAWIIWQKLGSAVAMGLAIAGMHYTAMAAAIFDPGSICLATPRGIDSIWLVLFVSIGSLAIISMTLLVSVFDAHLAEKNTMMLDQQKKANEEMRQSEERFRQLTENINEVFWMSDPSSSKIFYVSPAYERVLGRSCQSAYDDPRTVANAIHPEDRDRVLARLPNQAKGDFDEEFRIVRPDGSVRWLRDRAFPVRDARGDVYRIAGIAEDITERKHSEETLRENEDRFRLLFADNPLPMWVYDLETLRFMEVNDAAVESYGYSRDEFIGMRITDIRPPADLPVLMRDLARDRPTLEDSGTWRHRLKDGHIIDVQIVSHTMRWNGRNSALVVAQDITAIKRAEAELKTAKEAAEAANRAKSEFLAVMSHEIRTPMNGIMGMTELALDTELKPEQREYLCLVKDSADILLTLINDILDFSKIESGKLELDAAAFDLDDTISHAIRSLASKADPKGLEVAYQIQPDVPTAVIGDPGRLRQIIINLLGNAIKFTEHGEITVGVEKESATSAEARLHFTVTDTGVGIPTDKQQLIFEAFSQADSSTTRKYGGTGLGLTISRRIVDMMGGRIWVESEVGEGSTFHFTAGFALQKAPVAKVAPRETAHLRDLAVLVIDDNATNRRILDAMLRYWQMRPTSAEGGIPGLKAMEQAKLAGKSYPLVLIDSQMPDLDGFTVVERIKQDPALAGATIMMLTSAGQRGDASRCRKLGIAAYLIKPIRHGELLEAIQVALGTAPARGEPAPLVTRHWLREHRRRLRILLAEDNAVNRRLAMQLLQKRGHTALAAQNGLEALAALDTGCFDVVLMDVQMPEMDGFTATGLIREKERATGTHIPIIAMTAHALKGDREKCLAAGMDGYISKPINPEELYELIEGLGAGAKMPAKFWEDSPSDEPIIDMSSLLSRVEGDKELLAQMATLFLKENEESLAAMREAILQQDAGKLAKAAHTLKGAVANFAAPRALDAALRLEAVAQQGSLIGAEQAYQTLEEEIERLKPALEGLRNVVAPSTP